MMSDQMGASVVFPGVASAMGKRDVSWAMRSAERQRNYVINGRWLALGKWLSADVAFFLQSLKFAVVVFSEVTGGSLFLGASPFLSKPRSSFTFFSSSVSAKAVLVGLCGLKPTSYRLPLFGKEIGRRSYFAARIAALITGEPLSDVSSKTRKPSKISRQGSCPCFGQADNWSVIEDGDNLGFHRRVILHDAALPINKRAKDLGKPAMGGV